MKKKGNKEREEDKERQREKEREKERTNKKRLFPIITPYTNSARSGGRDRRCPEACEVQAPSRANRGLNRGAVVWDGALPGGGGGNAGM
jgi:hypothetical protein